MVELKTINILFMASEADPFIKVGGLGDVAGSLPCALRTLTETTHYDVRLVIPFHSPLRKKLVNLPVVARFSIPSRTGEIPAEVYYTEMGGVPTYLIDGAPIAETPNVYSTDARLDGWKYTFFSLACLELPRHLGWIPDILHANDWHAALAVYVHNKRKSQDPFYSQTGSILTIHNLPYMGTGTEEAFEGFALTPDQNSGLPWWAQRVPLALGLQAADRVVAVSPSYAREILTPQLGCGLENFLANRRDTVSGILNGIDDQMWNPATDAFIHARYDSFSLINRQGNKLALVREYGLSGDTDIPLLVMVGRMDYQKGIDLVLESLRMGRNSPWQAIILGTGDPALEDSVRKLSSDFKTRVRAELKFDIPLSHRLYAGGDLILMPSRYEPCGLSQMIAMRYGCIPLAHATGGLKDTIKDVFENPAGTGFLFDSTSPVDCGEVLQRALALFQDHNTWKSIQLRGMAQDFSWKKSALAYAKLYNELVLSAHVL